MTAKVEVPKEKAKLPKIVNCAVDATTHTLLTHLMRETEPPTLAAVLQKITYYYWSRGPTGHLSLPPNE